MRAVVRCSSWKERYCIKPEKDRMKEREGVGERERKRRGEKKTE